MPEPGFQARYLTEEFGDCFAAGKKELGELPVPAFLVIKKKNIWF